MYAKVFTQILDSSVNEDCQVRWVFEDLLKLCDVNGVVDMTLEAISRRTNAPIEIVRKGIERLEMPDSASRNPEFEGRRIVRIDEHRTWGWFIVNYDHYRNLVSEEQKREKTRIRVANHRSRTKCNANVTHVTQSNESNAREREDVEGDGNEEVKITTLSSLGQFLEAWNTLGKPFPMCSETDKRKRAFKLRALDEFFSANWLAALNKVKMSPFCAGINDRGWIADVDFFLRPDSVVKIMEGKYDDRNLDALKKPAKKSKESGLPTVAELEARGVIPKAIERKVDLNGIGDFGRLKPGQEPPI